jgi:ubiquinone/menaquinone biosynthesis C-methylase UbiE
MLDKHINQNPNSPVDTTSRPLYPISSERFSVVFPSYINASDEKMQMIKSYQEFFTENQYFDKWNSKAKLQIVDLACGNGQTAIQLLESLKSLLYHDNIEVYASDIDATMVTQYQESIKRKYPNNAIIVKEEDALRNQLYGVNGKADLTIVSHALYHISPTEISLVLKNISNTLNENGLALISLLSEESDFQIIQNNFVSKFDNLNQSHLVVRTPTFSMLLNEIDKDIPFTIIPYSATLTLPVLKADFAKFKEWLLKPDVNNQNEKQYNKAKELLEFMLHRDWASLETSGKLKDFLELIELLIDKNQATEKGFATLDLSGATLVIYSQKK